MKSLSFARRGLAVFLLLSLFLALGGCSAYRVEKSTARQAEIVLHAGEHDIAFEVVNFFYHNYKTVIDGGDDSVWDGPDAETYHQRLWQRAVEASCELYAIFDCAEDFGLDPYGRMMEDQMDEAIKAIIDSYPTRRDYIAHLESLYMTDTVYRLMMRSYLCQQYLLEYSDGVASVSDEKLLAFCEDPEVINTLCLTVYFAKDSDTAYRWAQERADLIRAALTDVVTDDDFRAVAKKYATTYTQEMEYGTYMTLREFRRLCGDPSLSPSIGYTTDALFDTESFLVIRCIPKNFDTIRENPEVVRSCYLQYLIENKAADLEESMTLTDAGRNLNQSSFDTV